MMPFVTEKASPDYRQVPVLALYGANASGKTNVLKALDNLKRLLISGVKGTYHPNRLNPPDVPMASYEIELVLGNQKYLYSIEYNENAILLEKLARIEHEQEIVVFLISDGESDFRAVATEKVYTNDKLKEIFQVECVETGRNLQISSFLFRVAKGFRGLSPILTNIAELLVQGFVVYTNNRIPFYQAILRLAGGAEQDKIRVAFERVVKILSDFDFSIQSISLEESRGELENLLPSDFPIESALYDIDIQREAENAFVRHSAIVTHKGADGTSQKFRFASEESEGTKVAAGLIAVCLLALSRGQTLFIDDIDRSLHSLILTALVRLFKRKETNPHGAQLVFTLHDTIVLENAETRVSEVGIINNNVYTGTTLFRLSDLKDGKRQLENCRQLRMHYLEGYYTGIPHPNA